MLHLTTQKVERNANYEIVAHSSTLRRSQLSLNNSDFSGTRIPFGILSCEHIITLICSLQLECRFFSFIIQFWIFVENKRKIPFQDFKIRIRIFFSKTQRLRSLTSQSATISLMVKVISTVHTSAFSSSSCRCFFHERLLLPTILSVTNNLSLSLVSDANKCADVSQFLIASKVLLTFWLNGKRSFG